MPPPKSFVGTNPWEREEREKKQEMRREHARQWREYQIIELTNLQHRSQAQDEQLKTLILERDFERMAEEQEDLEDENDTAYPAKDSNVQEVIRLAQNSNQITTPLTSMKQVDVKMSIGPPPSAANKSDTASLSSMSNDAPSATSHVQPKSILKHNARNDRITSNSNPSSPSKQAKTTSFADERQRDENGGATLSNVVRDLNNLSFNDSDANAPAATTTSPANNYQEPEFDASADAANNNGGPPPPPERNSSYAIMSQKQQSLRSIVGTTGSETKLSQNTGKRHPTVTKPSKASYPTHSDSSESISDALSQSNSIVTTTTTDTNSAALGSPNNNNASTAGPAQSVTNLSLTTMMAIRDNKRVSFHDEDNNPIPVHLTLPETTVEDPNVSVFVFSHTGTSKSF